MWRKVAVGSATWTLGMSVLVYLSSGLRWVPLDGWDKEFRSLAARSRSWSEASFPVVGRGACMIVMSPSELEAMRGRRTVVTFEGWVSSEGCKGVRGWASSMSSSEGV